MHIHDAIIYILYIIAIFFSIGIFFLEDTIPESDQISGKFGISDIRNVIFCLDIRYPVIILRSGIPT